MYQTCAVVRVPRAVSVDDIAAIFNLQEKYRNAHGEPLPKQPFWMTTYLSTDGLFQRLEPELYARISTLRHSVDPKAGYTANELDSLKGEISNVSFLPCTLSLSSRAL